MSRAVLRNYFPFNISDHFAVFWNDENDQNAPPSSPQTALSEVWARLDYEGEPARNFQVAAQNFPNDKTLLALRLRYDKILRFNETWESQARQDGPLLASWADWSVRIQNPIYASPSGAAPFVPLGAPPPAFDNFPPPKLTKPAGLVFWRRLCADEIWSRTTLFGIGWRFRRCAS